MAAVDFFFDPFFKAPSFLTPLPKILPILCLIDKISFESYYASLPSFTSGLKPAQADIKFPLKS